MLPKSQVQSIYAVGMRMMRIMGMHALLGRWKQFEPVQSGCDGRY